MTPFKEHLKSRSYSSLDADLVREIVTPVLHSAVEYSRSVGFMKLNHLKDAAESLGEFVFHEGKARFLIGCPLNSSDFSTLSQTTEMTANHVTGLENELREMLASGSLTSNNYHLALVQYMVARKQMEIHLVLKPLGMHHEKIRIAKDAEGDVLVTVGSDNDTVSGLATLNHEAGSLFLKSDYPETLWAAMAQDHIDRFERIWSGELKGLKTFTLSQQITQQITADWDARGISDDELKNFILNLVRSKGKGVLPELRGHQIAAKDSWQEAGFRGILAHCTGAGKTVTSLYCAKGVSDFFVNDLEKDFFVVVAVPFKILAEQWFTQITDLGYDALRCWDSREIWESQAMVLLQDSAFKSDSRLTRTTFFVCVNNTLVGDSFQRILNQLPKDRTMFIADEVHRHGGERYQQKIPQFSFMLGLSATPWAQSEDDRKNNLIELYGDVIHEYGIGEALNDKVLCPYVYEFAIVKLSEEEESRYAEISQRIGQILTVDFEFLSEADKQKLRQLFRSRNAVVGSCNEKYEWLARHLADPPLDFTLFYCGDGKTEQGESLQRDIERAGSILRAANWRSSKITAEESSDQRTVILEAFKERELNAIRAIKVLDEGFDLPACRNAYLLASSKNERQFVQRRGRVLRRPDNDPDKVAFIHDFLVVSSDACRNEGWAMSLATDEIIRCYEFARFAENEDDLVSKIREVADSFGVSSDEVFEMVESRMYMSAVESGLED